MAIEPTEQRASDGSVMWRCRCECGNETFASSNNILRGNTRSCGCYHKDRVAETQKKFNHYTKDGDVCVGIASNTQTKFYIDADDFNKVSQYTWFENDQGYMVTNLGGNHFVRMHRMILDEYGDTIIDHKNRNRADNRKSNLRLATHQLNGINRAAGINNLTGVKGVQLSANKTKYIARICVDGKTIHLGNFDSIEEAQSARIAKEVELFGEFAYIEGGD